MRGPWHDIWRFALFFGFLLALFAVPHTSIWFGLVLLVPVLGALAVAASMLRVAIRRRRAARVLARQPVLGPLHGHERMALEWFGQPQRISWRMPRGNVVDLVAAVREAGRAPVVRQLEGACHTLVRGRHHDRHDFIGDVEVLMLPGAERAVAAANRAEVLLCGDIAVVLALNGRWDVREARALLR
ncbi:hypothetical protein STPYR_12287 [uncultured Stenotrophomonas sp.]|uniref:Transmembrane protein n=1 Tax=uncultured Stenotrophomonas sp. TaxID=165438 RepID=A0A1Y5QAG9_9GAMM|nr:hypothetical protein STPYR_12287 [uncultured Stenotrophomonas sp.]